MIINTNESTWMRIPLQMLNAPGMCVKAAKVLRVCLAACKQAERIDLTQDLGVLPFVLLISENVSIEDKDICINIKKCKT